MQSWVITYGFADTLKAGKTYMLNGRRGKVVRTSFGGAGSEVPMALIRWA
ncbi:MAG: hypothetical protein WBM09_12145 [Gallionella sp.]